MTTDGMGVVSHAGTVLLAELADRIGLTVLLSQATDGLRERRAGHDPGRVLIDVAVAIADGAVTITAGQALVVCQDLHVADRHGPISDRDRDINEHPARVMAGAALPQPIGGLAQQRR